MPKEEDKKRDKEKEVAKEDILEDNQPAESQEEDTEAGFSEDDFDDLAKEETKEKEEPKKESFKIMEEDQKNIPHVSSLSASLPSGGVYSKGNPGKGSVWHLLILVVIGILAVGATVYLLKGGFNFSVPNFVPTPTPTATPEPIPTPTPTPEPLERANFKVSVLNGTGTSGLAKKTADKLKSLGYQIDKTGNATNSAFTQTVVRVKPSLQNLLSQLIKDLTPDFSGSGGPSLEDSSSTDAEVILGKE